MKGQFAWLALLRNVGRMDLKGNAGFAQQFLTARGSRGQD